MQPHGPGLNGRPGAGGGCRSLGRGPCQLLLRCRRDGPSGRRCRRPGQDPDQRLSAACGECLPGSEPRGVWMVRRRSPVRFRKGALAHKPGRRRLTCVNIVRRRLRVLRLATAETCSLRLVVPNTCPRLSRHLPASVAQSVGAGQPPVTTFSTASRRPVRAARAADSAAWPTLPLALPLRPTQ